MGLHEVTSMTFLAGSNRKKNLCGRHRFPNHGLEFQNLPVCVMRYETAG